MPGRRASARPSVAVTSLADTGSAPTDRVMIQAEQGIQDLQDRTRSLRSQVLALSGRALGRRVLTGSGTYVPAQGTTMVLVRGVACGGGGGGAGGGAGAAAGGGGASGEYWEAWIDGGPRITGGSYSAPTSGGSGGSSAGGNASAGSDATIVINATTYTLRGGGGGNGMTSVAANGFAAQGHGVTGSAPGGVLMRQDGEPGFLVSTLIFWGGAGGSTPLGSGGGTGDAASGSSPGRASSGYGGGGGGAAASGATGKAGAPGGAAVWVIEEYS